MRTTQPATHDERTIADRRVASFGVAPGTVARVLFGVLALLIAAHLIFSINQEHLGYDFFGSTMLWVLFDLQGEVTVPT